MSLKDKIPNKIPNLSKLGLNKIKVYAFVGPSGTGKSYRAQMVASEKNVNYIIDDGLLIKDNEVIAGESAKKAPTKIETVKHALFYTDEEKESYIEESLERKLPPIEKKNFKAKIKTLIKNRHVERLDKSKKMKL